jgi:AsmA protein
VTGIGEFTAELSGSRDPALFARTLAGNVVFRVHDARFSGFDLGGALRRAGVSAEDAADATTFSTLSATAVGENGSFVTEDLSGQSALLRLDGEGVFDVAGERVQLAMRLIPITPPEGQAPRELDGVVLPVTVAGSLRQPTFEVDLNSVVRQAAGRALDKQLLEHGDTLKQIEDSLGIDNLEERLRGLLGQ